MLAGAHSTTLGSILEESASAEGAVRLEVSICQFDHRRRRARCQVGIYVLLASAMAANG